jgi:1-acyl-sn-glycerol-3-phosphate acyltransferase
MKGSVQGYYADKTVFLTGATGLLGKVLVEKFVRDFPQIRRLYVLIRPKNQPDGTVVTPSARLDQEIIQSSAFDKLRGNLGEDFQRLVEAKVVAIGGDLSQDFLGMDSILYQQLQQEVDLVINCAAMVTFDGRFDMAVELNTLGPRRVLDFVNTLKKPALVHVSTCYVNGTREGEIEEEPLDPRRSVASLNGTDDKPYDVDEEVNAILRKAGEMRSARLPFGRRVLLRLLNWISRLAGGGSTDTADMLNRAHASWIERRLVLEGLRWARSRGWSDTYTFTKAMGEQLVMRYRGNIPVIILRPAIIEGALAAPEPGWLDGFRMLDPLVVAYGRGSLPDFPGESESIVDIVPVDLVGNAILAIALHARPNDPGLVYQVASGVENPITLRRFADLVQEHFQVKSLTGRDRASRVPRITFPNRASFLRRLRYRFMLPLQFLNIAAVTLGPLPGGRRLRSLIRSRMAAVSRLEYYVRIYGPYAEVPCQYISRRVRAVWENLSEEDKALLNFDVSGIDWPYYVQDVYIPGIRRFLLGVGPKQSQSATSHRVGRFTPLIEGQAGRHSEQPIDDSLNAAKQSDEESHVIDGTGQRSGSSESNRRTASPAISGHSVDVERWARPAAGFKKMARGGFRLLTGLGYRHYLSLASTGVNHIPKVGPFIVVANHNSHLDTGAIVQSLGGRGGHTKPLAARDYWFRTPALSWFSDIVLGAAPFDRQGHFSESLGLALELLRKGTPVLFFPEGGRSATGSPRPFKRGIGLLALQSGAPVIPARVQGTYHSLPKGKFLPKRSPVSVRFGFPIYPADWTANGTESDLLEVAREITLHIQRSVEELS